MGISFVKDILMKNRLSDFKKTDRTKYFILLHILLFIYSFASVCSKVAAGFPFLSIEFCFFYGLIILNLMVYALVWQQIIKHLPLTTAFCNKAVNIIWGILWGLLFFGETVSWNMIVGAVIVMVGVIIVVMSDE